MKYFIANWKANKNLKEAEEWFQIFIRELHRIQTPNIIIICPPSALIYSTKQFIKNEPQNIFIGSQDISIFDQGSYTGEVTGYSLQDLVNFAIIGHSERRNYFHENDESLNNKIKQARKYNIEPIFCIRGQTDKILPEVKFLAYEPVEAVGTGLNEEPEKVLEVKKSLGLDQSAKFLYGGSVNENNVNNYLKYDEIDGLLIGTASLDPIQFINIIKTV